MVSTDHCGTIAVDSDMAGSVAVLTVRGVLDATTYLALRDKIIKVALDEPAAVIVDVGELVVPAESAWAVLTSARWHVGTWPEVPILIACSDTDRRNALARNAISRYVPVYPSVASAIKSLARERDRPTRRRARADLPATLASLRRSRELVSEWLSAWSQSDLIPTAKVIVTAFVENVLAHTEGPPLVRLETNGMTVSIAVADNSRVPAVVRDNSNRGGCPSGLTIVAALCRAWGNSPTPSGKTVWAVIGPENRL